MFVRCARVVLTAVVGASLFGFATGFATSAQARVWVGADGISFKADYVRSAGDSIVIKQDGETHVMPFRRLSADDQAWVRAAEACRKQRDWKTHRFDVIRGRYEKLEGDTVFIRTRTGRRTVPLRGLSEADRRVITTYNEIPMVAGLAPTAAGEDPFSAGNVERVWTSKDGSKIVAEYRGLEGDKVVLFFKNREWKVDRSRFSAADQAYINARPKKAGVLMFDELDPEEDLPAARPTIKTDKASAKPLSHAAKIRRKMAEHRKAGTAGDSLEPGHDYRVQVVKGRRRVWVDNNEVFGVEADRIARLFEKEEQRQLYQPSMKTSPRHATDPEQKTSLAAEAASRVREAERALEPKRAARKPKAPKPATAPKMHYYECFACEKTIEATHALRVGDECPHCGATFDQLNDENGNVVDVSETVTGRRTVGLVKLVIFGVLGLGAFLGWISRQG